MADIVPEMKAGPLAIFVNALTRTTNARTIDEAIRTQFRTNPSIRLLDTKVPQSNAFVSGRTYRQPVHEIDPPGKSAQSASFVMHSLLHELLPHLKGLWVEGHRPADLEVGK
jgi:cellulose biosynthesis protein BcsQ